MSKPDTSENELFELCKEVYEKTGWKSDLTWAKNEGEDWSIWNDTEMGEYSYPGFMSAHPAYTSDYLLEKLPQSIDAGRSFAVDMFLVLDRPKSLKYRYRAFYTAPSYGKRHEVVADTPLKALLKLTIALSEAGELK